MGTTESCTIAIVADDIRGIVIIVTESICCSGMEMVVISEDPTLFCYRKYLVITTRDGECCTNNSIVDIYTVISTIVSRWWDTYSRVGINLLTSR